MPVAEKFRHARVDADTLERLKRLAGDKPVASYLRELSAELSDNLPESLKDVRSSNSFIPVMERLEGVTWKLDRAMRKLDRLFERVQEVDAYVQALDATLGEVLAPNYSRSKRDKTPPPNYYSVMKRNYEDAMQVVRKQIKWERAAAVSPEYQAAVRALDIERAKAGKPGGPVQHSGGIRGAVHALPEFVWNDAKGDYEYKEDGTPVINTSFESFGESE